MHLSGNEIRIRREELHLSQTKLANEVGISRQYLIKIESGKAENVGDDIMRRFIFALRYDCANTELNTPFDVQIAKLRAGYESGELSLTDCIRLGEFLQSHISEESQIAELSLSMAAWYSRSMRYQEATRCAIVASEHYLQTNDRIRWAYAYYEKANVEYDRGDFTSAIEKWLYIENRLATISVPDPIFTRLTMSIALAAAALHDYGLMNEYIDKCEEYIEYVPESRRARFNATNWYLRGEAYLKSGAFKDALDAYTMSFCLYSELNDNRGSLRMRNNIGLAHFKAGNLDEAERVAIEVYEQKKLANESPSVIAETSLLLAEIALARKETDEALQIANHIVELEGVDPGRIARTYRIIARVCYIDGDMDKFNRYMTMAVQQLSNKQYCYLKIEIMEEYMIANHLPMSFK